MALVEQNEEWSKFLYKYMDSMQLNVTATSDKFGVSRQQFYKWLNGGIPSLGTIRDIIDVIAKNTDQTSTNLVEETLSIIKISLQKKADH